MSNNLNVSGYTNENGVPCVRIAELEHFTPSDIFECGQCFRFARLGEERYGGIARGGYIEAAKEGGEVVIAGSTIEDYYNIWRDYFTIDFDYGKIIKALSADPVIGRAISSCPGLRILRQEPFETLISFIISQNNNIPRIKKIVESLCRNFGEPLDAAGTRFAFPAPEALASFTIEELAPIRAGFRAKYILAASRMVADNIINLGDVYNMSVSEGVKYLCAIPGVGIKVASCALLFAYGKYDAFPIDVWVRRILQKYYAGAQPPEERFGEYAGIAGEYLYYYERKISRESV